MLTVATLGPAGSNHEWVAARYLPCIGVEASRLRLFDDFGLAVECLRRGEADCMVQCAAHPDVARTIGANLGQVFVVDTFIAASRPLALLTRRDVPQPKSIGFHPATRSYVDLGPWEHHVEAQSTVAVAASLLAGRVDSGIAALELAQRHPDRLRVDRVIGSPQDAWLVYATTAVDPDGLIAWRESPGARWLRQRAAGPRL